MRLTRNRGRVIVSAALLLVLGGAPAEAGMEQDPAVYAHLAQDEGLGEFSEFAGDDVFDANDEGFVRENIDDDEAFEIGFDENTDDVLDDTEVLGEDVNNDEALTEDEFGVGVGAAEEEATGAADVVGAFGDDERFDANDEGFLRDDIDNDNLFEIGFDEDRSGTLEENEVLGTDFDDDDGLGAPSSDEGAVAADAAAGDFSEFAGDDNAFDVNDEGFLRENIDDDEAFEIGFDEDASGTLDENEVLGEDINEDEALDEDEFNAGFGIDADDDGTLGDHEIPGDEDLNEDESDT